MIQKFQSKPRVIEAEQYLGVGQSPLPMSVCLCGLMMTGIRNGCQPHIHTFYGQRIDLTPGDWIISERGCGFYTIMPDVFAATYALCGPEDRILSEVKNSLQGEIDRLTLQGARQGNEIARLLSEIQVLLNKIVTLNSKVAEQADEIDRIKETNERTAKENDVLSSEGSTPRVAKSSPWASIISEAPVSEKPNPTLGEIAFNSFIQSMIDYGEATYLGKPTFTELGWCDQKSWERAADAVASAIQPIPSETPNATRPTSDTEVPRCSTSDSSAIPSVPDFVRWALNNIYQFQRGESHCIPGLLENAVVYLSAAIKTLRKL